MSILDAFRLDDKVALVTGANRGLGQAIALGLAEAGADIAGLNRSDDGGETQAQVTALGRRYQHVAIDLAAASVDELRQVITSVTTTMGHLDILVNNAGIIRRADLLDYSESDWDAVLQVNLKAAFFLAQAAAAQMKKQGSGKIINVASLLSYQGGIRVPAYTASKHGIEGLTMAMANELAPHNINVNAIAPGYMETDNTLALREDANRNAAIVGRIPVGRWGQASELQGAAVFLASAASAYVHGATIPVDGGWLAR
jgi:2-dehydro-3-deoxy-D-gluconate 5-dehydrogenase